MKRPSYKTMSLEGLELVKSHSYPASTYCREQKSALYKLSESETDKTITTSYLSVIWYKNPDGEWGEEHRYKQYTRRAKYLAINGTLKGQYVLRDTPGYKLFYTQYGTGDSNLPRRVMIDVEDMARRLGLLW